VRLLLTILFSSGFSTGSLWPLAGVCAGTYVFYRGFRLFQRKRLIMDTPSSKIRSASIGLVEVSGLAVGPYTISAPIGTVACYYYRTMAWQYRQEGKDKKWVKVVDESLHVPFYLDDNTGQVLINPQGAEMDIHRDYHQEFSDSVFSTCPSVPGNVASFLARHGVGIDKKIKVEEYCIKPKNALFVLGTLAVNPGLDVSPTPIQTENTHEVKFTLNLPDIMTTGSAESEFHIGTGRSLTFMAGHESAAIQQEVIRLAGESAPIKTADMSQQQKIGAALMKAGITTPAAWAAAGVSDATTAIAHPASGATSAHSGSNGTAAAPAVAAPEFDLHPSVVLMRGTHNPAFFISWRSQKDVLKSLAWKSALMIWGGPLLALLSAYILLSRFEWL